MRSTASPSDGAPSPTISGCGAGNRPPSPSPADLAKNWGPGLDGSPMNLMVNSSFILPIQNQQPFFSWHRGAGRTAR
eukprot:scaffold3975_cov75-Phaeocystis_antarctica.AAC.2